MSLSEAILLDFHIQLFENNIHVKFLDGPKECLE